MITKEKSKITQNNNPEFNNKHPRNSDGTFASKGLQTLISYSKTGTNNIFREKKSYVGQIEPNEKAKKIYSKVFGNEFADNFYLSPKQLQHINQTHPEVEIEDIEYCLNNPNYITEILKSNQANIISKLPNGKYVYILVDIKLNKRVNVPYTSNGILSARYLNEENKQREFAKNRLIYKSVD